MYNSTQSILQIALGLMRMLAMFVLLAPALASAITPLVVSGAKHTCSLSSLGEVKCWGDNSSGQLGDGTNTTRKTPVAVTGLSAGVKALALGANHACAVTSTGEVKCWGKNDTGQLGDNRLVASSSPVTVGSLGTDTSALTAGLGHTCALAQTGGIKCWGLNNFGQIGDGTSATNRLLPVSVSGLSSNVLAMSAGDGHTCAVTSSASLKCWGDNFYGQLGDGSTTARLVPTDVSSLASGVTAVTAGKGYSCALVSGAVKCWGLNNLGQLGDGGTINRLTPRDVSGLTTGASAVVASSTHTCAQTSSGGVKCWGYNTFGQLGDNSSTSRLAPVDVIGFTSEVTMVTAADEHSCALTASGGIKCWGHNDLGQLGDGGYNTTGHSTPWDVNGLATGVGAIAVGNSYVCAVTTGGGAKCWGVNANGQLGDGSTATRRTPVDVSGLSSGISTITASGTGVHTCALTTVGGVKCWGYNGYGQLGDGSTTQRLTAVDVTGLTSGVIAISLGNFHTCALTTMGGVKCWGSNGYGQLGDGTTTQRLTAVDVTGLTSGVIAIATGESHTCAVTNVGGVKCWGSNGYGQLGDGTTTQRLTAVDVTGLTSGASAVAAGGYYSYGHTCALIRGGGAKCWGTSGALGNGGSSSLTPVDVSNLPNGGSAIVASGDWNGYYNTSGHTCVLTSMGGAKCWGNDYVGQLGDGPGYDYSSSGTPVDVTGLTSDVSAIATGFQNTCAITSSSGMKCWGDNSYGQLGDGTATIRPNASLFVVGLVLIDNPALAAGTNPSTTGQSVNFTAAVTGMSPVGTVTFNFGDGSITQTVGLADGQASLSHVFSTNGSYAVTAAYSGDNSNVAGTSAALTQSVATVPGAPTITAATAGNGSATLSFNAPSSNGGASITAYKASCDETTVSGISSPITVGPLVNGISYSCTVVAHNIMGDGAPSPAASLTPAAPPSAPTLVSATAGNAQATVTFTPPDSNGGSAITGYTVTSSPSGGTDSNGGSTGLSHSIIGLVNGSTYIFTVTATNSAGTGVASVASNSVTPKGNQTIGAISFSPNSLAVGGITSAIATATSNLAVSFSSITLSVCTISGSTVTGITEGTCTIAADQPGNATYSAAPQVTANITVTAATSRLINISTRGQVSTGDGVMIGGFIISGIANKKVLIRAIGPNLANFGIAGTLPDPKLELFEGPTLIGSNDNWQTQSIPADVAAITATGLAPANVAESALLVTLKPGVAYTAVVTGVNVPSGVGIVEVFEADNPEYQLINISTRGRVQTGEGVMIGGFIIQGDAPKTVLIRAVGPNLANFGVSGVLADPMMDIYRSSDGVKIASNDDWQTQTNAADVSAITATGLPPADPRESAILLTLPPGAYTAVVSGKNGGTGVGIVEVFAQ